jgi:hypothetical protein
VQSCGDGDVLALGRPTVRRERDVVVVDLVLRDVLFGDGFDEESRASDVVLVIHVEAVLVFREDDVLWPGHGSIIRTSRNKKRDNRVAYLRMGTPVTVVSLNAVYQTEVT